MLLQPKSDTPRLNSWYYIIVNTVLVHRWVMFPWRKTITLWFFISQVVDNNHNSWRFVLENNYCIRYQTGSRDRWHSGNKEANGCKMSSYISLMKKQEESRTNNRSLRNSWCDHFPRWLGSINDYSLFPVSQKWSYPVERIHGDAIILELNAMSPVWYSAKGFLEIQGK